MFITNSKIVVDGDKSEQTTTKVFNELTLKCLNKNCTGYETKDKVKIY